MKKFTSLTSTVIPLATIDIDTDMIIPAQYLTSIRSDGYGEHLFRRMRDQDPNFPLNLPRFIGAKALVVGRNFGCGSSREHAVWALLGAGFEVIIGSSFADIFAANSSKNGLVLVTLSETIIQSLLDRARQQETVLTVNLVDQTVTLPDRSTVSFPFDPFRKHCIVNGLDDIDYILSQQDAITAFRADQERIRFFSTVTLNHEGEQT